ncbi:MAG TPA: hypothetical protein VKD66_08840 [Streptosporangiaceae bacterium]|nr:hypothetical protein [Streptosporangiaceae bacterium]
MGEPDDQEDSSRLRAEQLREQIEELRRRKPAPSRPLSPREFTDDAAREENRGNATDGES